MSANRTRSGQSADSHGEFGTPEAYDGSGDRGVLGTFSNDSERTITPVTRPHSSPRFVGEEHPQTQTQPYAAPPTSKAERGAAEEVERLQAEVERMRERLQQGKRDMAEILGHAENLSHAVEELEEELTAAKEENQQLRLVGIDRAPRDEGVGAGGNSPSRKGGARRGEVLGWLTRVVAEEAAAAAHAAGGGGLAAQLAAVAARLDEEAVAGSADNEKASAGNGLGGLLSAAAAALRSGAKAMAVEKEQRVSAETEADNLMARLAIIEKKLAVKELQCAELQQQRGGALGSLSKQSPPITTDRVRRRRRRHGAPADGRSSPPPQQQPQPQQQQQQQRPHSPRDHSRPRARSAGPRARGGGVSGGGTQPRRAAHSPRGRGVAAAAAGWAGSLRSGSGSGGGVDSGGGGGRPSGRSRRAQPQRRPSLPANVRQRQQQPRVEVEAGLSAQEAEKL
jgi:hypothetical protein